MSIESKYHITEKQLDELLSCCIQITIHVSVFIVCFVGLILLFLPLILHNKDFNHISVYIKILTVTLLPSLIMSSIKFSELINHRRMLLTKIRGTAHYSCS
jgi:hypothetical protein